jgi:hypothetical protein
MNARLWLCLTALTCPLLCLAAAPQVLIETRLEPAAGAVVGQTIQLQVDVLTDTWFSAAPVLPSIEVDNAVVSAPSSEARHLNLQRDGQAFFALEFTYQITPTAAGDFVIAPLNIRVTPGQASAPIALQSETLHFAIAQPPGVAVGQTIMVARQVTLTQQIRESSAALAVGDTVQRQVTLSAEGAQMMLMPPAEFKAIDGLKLYPQPPQLSALDDGRGQVLGGQRSDSASYVIQRTGEFQLPAMQVPWWDSATRQLRSAELPAVTFNATAGPANNVPYSVREDLQRLGQHSGIALSRHGLVWGLWGMIVAGALHVAWPYSKRASRWLAARRALRQRQWLASPRYALRQIKSQLSGQPPRLDALYLWVRRQYGSVELAPLRTQLPAHLTDALYGRQPTPSRALANLLRSPALKYRAARNGSAEDACLRPLNPRTTELERRP